MSKILVTGVNGFVGKHLVQELNGRNCEVIGVGRDDSADFRVADKLVSYHSCDLTNPEEVEKLNLIGVDAVISLAGLARVGDSFKNPDAYMDINVKVLSVIGQKILADSLKPRILSISTGAVYDSAQDMPLLESSKLLIEGSPYVNSKLQMEKATEELREEGLDCVTVRPFNHTGPEQETGFLLPDLYQKILQSHSSNLPLKVGNLDTKRDYTDVRDVARAYADLALSEHLNYDLYNVCSGLSIAGRDILNWLQKAMQIHLRIEKDESLYRPNDPIEIYGSYERLRQDTGWAPSIPIDKTVADFVKSADQQHLLAA